MSYKSERKIGKKLFNSFEISKILRTSSDWSKLRMMPSTSSYWMNFSRDLKRVKMTRPLLLALGANLTNGQ